MQKDEVDMVPNLIVSISGTPKTGKSHLALTFPAPLVVFSFDVGLEPVLAKFPNKEIDVKTYPVPIVDSVKATGFQKEIKGVWDSFNDDLKRTTGNIKVKTLVVDTWTAVYELARIARACELGQENLLQFQYGDVYLRLKALIQYPRLAGQNLVLTTYLRDRYVKDSNTGEKELDGWRGTESEVDVVLWTRKERKSLPGGQKRNVIITLIKDTRYDDENLTLSGQELEMATYDDIIAVLGVV